jgi:hypothetical protein
MPVPDHAFLVAVDGTVTPLKPGNGKSFTLDEVQALVGGYVQLLAIQKKPFILYALMDEDGLLKRLPLNPEASRIATQKMGRDMIMVGPIVICPQKFFR